MATKTKNYNLTKPGQDEYYDVDIFNENADIIDDTLLNHKHNAVEIKANTNLNNLGDAGYYWCTSNNSNTVTNKPDNVLFFGLRVSKISNGVFSQELLTSDNRKFIRIYWSGGWTGWTKFSTADDLAEKANTGHKHAKSDITDFPQSLKNPQALTISLNGISQGGYDGSSAKNINITAQSVGAATNAHTHELSDLTGSELYLLNPSASSEGYFYLVNWRYTSYNRFVLGYRKNDDTDIPLLEYLSTEGNLKALIPFVSKNRAYMPALELYAEKNGENDTSANNGGYVDFHYNQKINTEQSTETSGDYTTRLIENAPGELNVQAGPDYKAKLKVGGNPVYDESRITVSTTDNITAGVSTLAKGNIILVVE